MKYTIQALTKSTCDCEDCRAGKHLYQLLRWKDQQWHSVGISLQGYTNAEECKQNHYWGLQFQPDDVWEDGSPIADTALDESDKQHFGPQQMVPLNTKALAKSADSLRKHWL